MQPTLPAFPSRSPQLGARRGWSVDLAVVGGVTTLALGVVSPLAVTTVLVAAAFSAAGGAVLGAFVPTLLNRHVRRIPVLVLLAAGVGLGALWLGGSGVAAALVTGRSWIWTLQITATAGAVQLGWLWLPLVLNRARGRATIEWVLLACIGAPLIGYLAYQHVIF